MRTMPAADAKLKAMRKRLDQLMKAQDEGKLTDEQAFELQRLSDEYETLLNAVDS
jgi:hypothetical protein